MSDRATRLLLVRHGHVRGVNANGEAILLGWTDVGLDSLGREQARRVGVRLRHEAAGAAIYASPLARTMQTAALIARPDDTIVECEDLREIGCGRLDGSPIERIRAEYAALWEANERQADEDLRWPGGESYRELRMRVLRCLGRIATRHPGQTVIVVTHTGVITQVAGAIRGVSAARWGVFRVHPASISEVRWARAERTLVRLDDRAHLEGMAA
jgi:alpha-ribazole phosphatase/probable phosphoglycerate mutase